MIPGAEAAILICTQIGDASVTACEAHRAIKIVFTYKLCYNALKEAYNGNSDDCNKGH